jgi:hypothetical protein
VRGPRPGLDCPCCGEPNDYIPKGGLCRGVRNVRAAGDGDVLRCGAQVGDDPQSGPIYCGDRASWIGNDVATGLLVCVCARHEKRLRKLAVAQEAAEGEGVSER